MKDAFSIALVEAAEYLKKADPILEPVITKYGPPKLTPHKNYYEALTGEIISQQLSVKAAASIRTRFIDLFSGTFPDPADILEKDIETLRTVGLSRAKASYIRDMAAQIISGNLQFEHFDSLTNDEISKKLTVVKGVGEWTSHMFLMFCMGRLDVLAYGDLGIQVGIRELYGLKNNPKPEEVKKIAVKHRWHPYETIACWYVWASKDNKPG